MKTRLSGALAAAFVLALPASAAAAPVASFQVTPTQPAVGQPAQFDASGSMDDGDPIATYEWDFQNDGSIDATGIQQTFTFATPGDHPVRLVVTEGGDTTENDEVVTQVTVTPNEVPIVQLAKWPANPVAGETVTIQSFSYDPDGDALTHAWDVDGDGFDDGTGTTVEHTFPQGGATVQVRVTDNEGAISVDEITFTVGPPENPPANQLPVAQFSRSPLAPVAGQAVTFQSFSYDPDGGSLIHAWDIDGDGFDDGAGATLVRAFPAGARTVRLRVTDNEGAPVIGQVAFNVATAPPNPLPVAQFAVSPLDPVVEQAVTLQSYSYDPQGEALTHAWDLDNDGAFDDGTGSSAQTRFNAAESRVVRLRVMDAAGGWQIASRTVRVAPAPLTRLGAKVRIAGTFRQAGTRLYAFKVESAIGARSP